MECIVMFEESNMVEVVYFSTIASFIMLHICQISKVGEFSFEKSRRIFNPCCPS